MEGQPASSSGGQRPGSPGSPHGLSKLKSSTRKLASKLGIHSKKERGESGSPAGGGGAGASTAFAATGGSPLALPVTPAGTMPVQGTTDGGGGGGGPLLAPPTPTVPAPVVGPPMHLQPPPLALAAASPLEASAAEQTGMLSPMQRGLAQLTTSPAGAAGSPRCQPHSPAGLAGAAGGVRSQSPARQQQQDLGSAKERLARLREVAERAAHASSPTSSPTAAAAARGREQTATVAAAGGSTLSPLGAHLSSSGFTAASPAAAPSMGGMGAGPPAGAAAALGAAAGGGGYTHPTRAATTATAGEQALPSPRRAAAANTMASPLRAGLAAGSPAVQGLAAPAVAPSAAAAAPAPAAAAPAVAAAAAGGALEAAAMAPQGGREAEAPQKRRVQVEPYETGPPPADIAAAQAAAVERLERLEQERLALYRPATDETLSGRLATAVALSSPYLPEGRQPGAESAGARFQPAAGTGPAPTAAAAAAAAAPAAAGTGPAPTAAAAVAAAPAAAAAGSAPEPWQAAAQQPVAAVGGTAGRTHVGAPSELASARLHGAAAPAPGPIAAAAAAAAQAAAASQPQVMAAAVEEAKFAPARGTRLLAEYRGEELPLPTGVGRGQSLAAADAAATAATTATAAAGGPFGGQQAQAAQEQLQEAEQQQRQEEEGAAAAAAAGAGRQQRGQEQEQEQQQQQQQQQQRRFGYIMGPAFEQAEPTGPHPATSAPLLPAGAFSQQQDTSVFSPADPNKYEIQGAGVKEALKVLPAGPAATVEAHTEREVQLAQLAAGAAPEKLDQGPIGAQLDVSIFAPEASAERTLTERGSVTLDRRTESEAVLVDDLAQQLQDSGSVTEPEALVARTYEAGRAAPNTPPAMPHHAVHAGRVVEASPTPLVLASEAATPVLASEAAAAGTAAAQQAPSARHPHTDADQMLLLGQQEREQRLSAAAAAAGGAAEEAGWQQQLFRTDAGPAAHTARAAAEAAAEQGKKQQQHMDVLLGEEGPKQQEQQLEEQQHMDVLLGEEGQQHQEQQQEEQQEEAAETSITTSAAAAAQGAAARAAEAGPAAKEAAGDAAATFAERAGAMAAAAGAAVQRAVQAVTGTTAGTAEAAGNTAGTTGTAGTTAGTAGTAAETGEQAAGAATDKEAAGTQAVEEAAAPAAAGVADEAEAGWEAAGRAAEATKETAAAAVGEEAAAAGASGTAAEAGGRVAEAAEEEVTALAPGTAAAASGSAAAAADETAAATTTDAAAEAASRAAAALEQMAAGATGAGAAAAARAAAIKGIAAPAPSSTAEAAARAAEATREPAAAATGAVAEAGSRAAEATKEAAAAAPGAVTEAGSGVAQAARGAAGAATETSIGAAEGGDTSGSRAAALETSAGDGIEEGEGEIQAVREEATEEAHPAPTGLAASLLGAAAHAVHAVQEQLQSVLQHGRQLASEQDTAGSEMAAGGGSIAGESEGEEEQAAAPPPQEQQQEQLLLAAEQAPAQQQQRGLQQDDEGEQQQPSGQQQLLHATEEEEAAAAAADIQQGALMVGEIEDEAKLQPEAAGPAAAGGPQGPAAADAGLAAAPVGPAAAGGPAGPAAAAAAAVAGGPPAAAARGRAGGAGGSAVVLPVAPRHQQQTIKEAVEEEPAVSISLLQTLEGAEEPSTPHGSTTADVASASTRQHAAAAAAVLPVAVSEADQRSEAEAARLSPAVDASLATEEEAPEAGAAELAAAADVAQPESLDATYQYFEEREAARAQEGAELEQQQPEGRLHFKDLSGLEGASLARTAAIGPGCQPPTSGLPMAGGAGAAGAMTAGASGKMTPLPAPPAAAAAAAGAGGEVPRPPSSASEWFADVEEEEEEDEGGAELAGGGAEVAGGGAELAVPVVAAEEKTESEDGAELAAGFGDELAAELAGGTEPAAQQHQEGRRSEEREVGRGTSGTAGTAEGHVLEELVEDLEHYMKDEPLQHTGPQAPSPAAAEEVEQAPTAAPEVATAEGEESGKSGRQAQSFASQYSVGGLKEPPPGPALSTSPAGGGAGDVPTSAAEVSSGSRGGMAVASSIASRAVTAGAGAGRPSRLQSASTFGSRTGETAPLLEVEEVGIAGGAAQADPMAQMLQGAVQWIKLNPVLAAGAAVLLPLLWVTLSRAATAAFGEFGPLLLFSGAIAIAASAISWLVYRAGVPESELEMLEEQTAAAARLAGGSSGAGGSADVAGGSGTVGGEALVTPSEPISEGSTEDLRLGGAAGGDGGLLQGAREAISGIVEEVLEEVEPGREQVGEVIQETESGGEEEAEEVDAVAAGAGDALGSAMRAVTGAASAMVHKAEELAGRAYHALEREAPGADISGQGAPLKDLVEGTKESAELASSRLVSGSGRGGAALIRESGYESDSEEPEPLMEGVHPAYGTGSGTVGSNLKNHSAAMVAGEQAAASHRHAREEAALEAGEGEGARIIEPTIGGEGHPGLLTKAAAATGQMAVSAADKLRHAAEVATGTAPEQQAPEDLLRDLQQSIAQMEGDRAEDVAFQQANKKLGV